MEIQDLIEAMRDHFFKLAIASGMEDYEASDDADAMVDDHMGMLDDEYQRCMASGMGPLEAQQKITKKAIKHFNLQEYLNE